jgi:alanine-glyoxylate transaminase/serine-glyoxylate transaminase/serine-pyruvate transaminase
MPIGYTRRTMSGRPFLSIPGPTLVPERITRAMAQPIIDHRGPKFGALVRECLAGLTRVFKAERGHIVLYPGSGTGAWEAAIVNTLSPGDRVLAVVNGHFATGFAKTAAAYGVDVERLDMPYGEGVRAAQVEARLAADGAHELRARPRRPQRDIHGRDVERGRRATRDGSRASPRAAARRYGVVARVDRRAAR